MDSQVPNIVEDPIEIIQMLSAVSERVAEYIQNEQYILDSDIGVDGVEESGVITQCYLILVEELKEKGIVFHEELDELLSTYVDSERIFHLYEWIDTKHQIDMCVSHPELIPHLENILNTEDPEDDLIVQWVKMCLPIVGNTDPHLSLCVRILPYLHTTEDFQDLLQYIYIQVENIPNLLHVPLEIATAYIKFMIDGQNNAKAALRILAAHEDVVAIAGYDTLHKLAPELDQYDVAKVSPIAISDYAWAWTIEEGYEDAPKLEDLPKTLQDKYHKLEVEHHTTTDHHIEYYLANKDIPVTWKAIILLLVACYAPGDAGKTKDKCNAVLSAAGDRFDDIHRKKFIDWAKILVAYAAGEIA